MKTLREFMRLTDHTHAADLDMWSINIAVRIGLAGNDTDTIVIVRNNILEPVLFTIAFQRRDHALRSQPFLGNLFKLGKQLAVQLALQC